ncbi:MAG: fimbrillin family protein [Duncaniella sp.]|nr:fimbrillin family protein [Duncaniella sp.]
MKKSIFFMAGCAVALASCTQTDVLEEGVQSSAIGFENAVSKESRALSNSTLNKFYVYGYYTKAETPTNPVSVFDGDEVTLKDGKWGYATTRYWVPGANYRFYAYSCENGAATCDAGLNLSGGNDNIRALKLANYTTHNHHDLIFATNDTGIEGKEKDNANVAFTFKHILSRVNVVFESDFAPDYEIEVSNVRFENIYNQGDYNPKADDDTWTNVRRVNPEGTTFPSVSLALLANENIASAKNPNDETSTEVKAKTEAGYVIPHEYSTSLVRLVFDISVKQKGDEMFTRTLTGSWSPNWVEGNAYTYNVKIDGEAASLEPIVFETTQDIAGFDPGSTTEVNMSFSGK